MRGKCAPGKGRAISLDKGTGITFSRFENSNFMRVRLEWQAHEDEHAIRSSYS
jgi:hypothetical protein